ncbi:MAG: V-type ATP synthase subunit K, partial [Candidatus Omnitrophota bacterium]
MEAGLLAQFKDLGLSSVLAFSAIGSGLGTGVAAMAAVGAWKKAFSQNKAASFMLVAFVGAPLTQTIYGMILMNKMVELANKGFYVWNIGIFCGIAMGISALMQGKAAAVACDAMGETGKGFGN